MKFSLIICTYMRPKPLWNLLKSVQEQTLYPSEILIVDGSTDLETADMLAGNNFNHLQYFKVDETDRGLTRQRNYGIQRVSGNSEVVCFLDDDTILDKDYFEKIVFTFRNYPDAIGVGGVATNENKWQRNTLVLKKNSKIFVLDNHLVKESSRNYLRNILGLESDKLPGVMPEFSHGKTCSYPLTGKTYPVDLIVGMSMSFRRSIFEQITFSNYFEGYGLYEDADFSLRALKYGQNYIATSAKLKHFHDQSGRPNRFKYGQMVVRNGWYVWRVKYPDPSIKAILKWHAITLLLTAVRFSNIFTTSKRNEALRESLGRLVGWLSLSVNKPQ